MAKHSYIGASKAHQYIQCSASAIIAKALNLTGESNEFSREGTAAHELAADIVRTGDEPMFRLGKSITVEGQDFPITAEMVDAVEMLYQEVLRQISENEGPHELFVEHHVQLKDISKDAFGTVDIGIWFPKANRLITIDFKYGIGIKVEADRNDQLRYYAWGLAQHVARKAKKKPSMVTTFRQVIVQPRVPTGAPITSEDIDYKEMAAWAHNTLKPAIEKIERGEIEYKSGPHCKYCPAMLHCVQLRENQLSVFDSSLAAKIPSLDEYALGSLLSQAIPVEMFIKALKAEALARLNRGEKVDGWTTKQGRASRDWSPEGVQKLVDKYGDEAYTKTLLSPAAVEKLPGGLEFAKENQTKTFGRPTLVQGSPSLDSYDRLDETLEVLKGHGKI